MPADARSSAPEQPGLETGQSTRGPSAAYRVGTLRKRRDFLRAARADRHPTAGFLLQARRRAPGESRAHAVRVGFTCSKKLGNAVTRNRAKRRLRAAARETLPAGGRPGWDYVLVGRPRATVERRFDRLCADLRAALARVHGEGG